MKTGVTSSGFEYAVDERRATDMRLVDGLAAIMSPDRPDRDKIVALSEVITILLGEEQKKALYDHIAANNDGIVVAQAAEAELNEMLIGAKELKNS